MSRPPGRGGNGGAGRGPSGRSNGRGPRGSNRGPTTGMCGAIVYVPALVLALLAVWAAR